MLLSTFRIMLFALTIAAAGASSSYAQTSWGELSVSMGRVDFDLSGTGNAPGFAVRASRDLTPNVRLQFGGMFAKPEQQFGPSNLFVPEAQLQYRWNVGRFTPYAGAGFGASRVSSDFHTDWDPVVSFSGGTAVWLSDRVGVTGEFRLRGHEWDFAGTTTELTAGITWRLPEF